MDILCKRYSDVHFLLDNLKINEFFDFLVLLAEELFEDKLWQIWINNPLKTTGYEEFKNQISTNIDSTKTKEEIENDAQEGYNKALAMLKGDDYYGG
jgi:hypothetical protein